MKIYHLKIDLKLVFTKIMKIYYHKIDLKLVFTKKDRNQVKLSI